jgi:hypothetical protein
MHIRSPHKLKWWLRGLLLVGLFGVVTGLYAALQLLSGAESLERNVQGVASFACFGFLLGGIYAFDGLSEMCQGNRPVLRAAIGFASGLSIGFIWHWPAEGIVLASLVATLLALLGMMWAKYVDFY